MAVRRQRATTSKEIMEKDITIAIKKAKTKYRYEKVFYILHYKTEYFASGYPDGYPKEEIYFQKWVFDESKNKWECES